MLLPRIRSQLAKNTTYNMAENIDFNPNIAFWIKMMKNKGFGKSLS